MPTAAAHRSDPPKDAPRHPPGVREHLLEIAGEVFAERGFEGATVKEITDRAGINVASVNYYFRDKFNLYLEVLRYSMAARQKALTVEGKGLSAEERLTRYLSGFMKTLVMVEGKPSWYGRIMVRELAQPTAALPQVVEEIIRPNCGSLQDLVAQVAGAGTDEETVRLLTQSVLSQCAQWKISRPIYALLWPELRMDAEQVERIARHIAAFSIAGIRGIAGQKRRRPAPKTRAKPRTKGKR